MKKLFFLVLLALTLCGCKSYMVVVKERNIPSYDIGKAIEEGIKRVESTGYYVSNIEIKKGSVKFRYSNCPNELKNSYDVIIYGDTWEKRYLYYYYRKAPNYDKVKKSIEERMREHDVWINN